MRLFAFLMLCLSFNLWAEEQKTPPSLESFFYENIKQQAQEETDNKAPSARLDQVIEGLRIQNEISKREMEFAMSKLDSEFWYVITLSTMCVLSLVIALGFLIRRDTYSPKDIVNVIGLTLIIYSTIILVLVVSTSEQLTAAIGVLGAIAGYLFRSVQESARERGTPSPSRD